MSNATLPTRRLPILAIALATAAISAPAYAHEPPASVEPATIAWADAPPVLPDGAEIAVLAGDPHAEGPFVLRLKFPAGYEVPAHTHSGDELITVISGTFNVGHGEALDCKATMPLPAGGFVEMPAGHPHFAWVGSETIVQIHGPGPFGIQYLDPADNPLTQ
jgi:quercetin dioxygenase-like cupin family protein